MTPTFDLHKRSHRYVLQGGFALLVLGVYLLIAAGVDVIPYPQRIAWAFQIQLSRGGLITATVQALYAVFAGYALAIVVGIPLGLIMGISSIVEEFLDTYVDALYALPLAAVIPALIVWFGSGFELRVAGVFLFALFPIVINTLEGAKETPEGLLEVARTFGASRYFVVKNVILPHEATYIATGLRLGITLAVKGLVVVEIIAAVTGFGEIINRWGSALQLEGVFSVVLTLMAIGIGLTWLLSRLEDRIVHWDTTRGH